MKLIDRIKSAFRRDPPPGPGPALRNRAGRMAWINSGAAAYPGAEVLVGHAVRTVALNERGMWMVDPQQSYVVTAPTRTSMGQIALPGDRVVIGGMADTLLDPWKDDGVTDAEVRELYAPKAKEPNHA